MKITSPDSTYTGRSSYGLTVLNFSDGVAEIDELPAGVRSYLQGAGYGIDGPAEELNHAELVDPRDLGDGRIGTPLRDAAVDPRPGDYLPPFNAGSANPHGPDVVSPEIHAARATRRTAPPVDGEGLTLPKSRPVVSAAKPEWVGWAVVQGLTPDDAEALTKADLIERFGAGQEADGTPDGDKPEGDKPEGTPEGTPAE